MRIEIRRRKQSPSWLSPEAAAFEQEVLPEMNGLSPRALSDLALTLDRRQNHFLENEAINLYPGTNILSPRVAKLFGSRLATRASEGSPGDKYQTGLRQAEEAEIMAAELVRHIFSAAYAEIRAISGTMANMAVLNSLTEPGDPIFSLSTPVGGHISHGRVGAAGYRRLIIHEIPYDADAWEIDLAQLRQEVQRVRPRLIIVGASLILFQYPVPALREIADEVDAYLLYDAAHVAGLIAGGEWQHPLREGAHVMTCSTYKSFGGPPGGLVLTDDEEIARGVSRAIFPGLTANFQTQRPVALMAAAAETLAFGADYARACADNAQKLAQALADEGLTVAGAVRGYTDGHMLALDVRGQGGGRAAAQALESAHIICNFNLLPWDRLGAVRDPSGVRLAVHEVTRWGASDGEMSQIASFFRRVLLEQEYPADIANEVADFKQGLNHIRYCFAADYE